MSTTQITTCRVLLLLAITGLIALSAGAQEALPEDPGVLVELPALLEEPEPLEISTTTSTPGVVQEVTLGGVSEKAGGVTFQLDGEFLVSGWNNANWRYTMNFGEPLIFRRIFIDLDFMRGQLGPGTDENQYWYPLYYAIFWLNNGRHWDDMIAYPNYLSNGRLWNETNAGGYWNPDWGEYGLQVNTHCPLEEGHWYHLKFIYDTVDHYLEFVLTENGQHVCTLGSDAGIDQIDTNWMFIEFGTSYSPEGPEGWTLGWRFANFKIQYLGDEPPGRRPRRR